MSIEDRIRELEERIRSLRYPSTGTIPSHRPSDAAIQFASDANRPGTRAYEELTRLEGELSAQRSLLSGGQENRREPLRSERTVPTEPEQLTDSRQRIVHVELVGIGEFLAARLNSEPDLIHSISPSQFEELVCDRLSAMGLEPKQVGHTNRPDGGIDIVFWPRAACFPFLGAVQVKHHRNPEKREGSPTVRDFAGAISGHPFNAGILVTNTSFTPDAEWFARERTRLIRLRDLSDIRRWLINNFADEQEWREIPRELELTPGYFVKIRVP